MNLQGVFGGQRVGAFVGPDVALIGAITPWERADGTRGVSRYMDTWGRRAGAWKAVRAQITPIRTP